MPIPENNTLDGVTVTGKRPTYNLFAKPPIQNPSVPEVPVTFPQRNRRGSAIPDAMPNGSQASAPASAVPPIGNLAYQQRHQPSRGNDPDAISTKAPASNGLSTPQGAYLVDTNYNLTPAAGAAGSELSPMPGQATSDVVSNPSAPFVITTPRPNGRAGAAPDAMPAVVNADNGVSAPPNNDYLTRFQQIQQQQAELAKQQELEYVPDKENKGRGVANWFNKVLRDPDDESKRRRTLTMIQALGDALRHSANLYYTSKGATPQNMQSYTPIQEARWKEEDATRAANAYKQEQLALQQSKAKADADYKAWQQRNGDINTQIRAGQYGLAAQKNARDAQKHGWEAEDRPFKQAERIASAKKAAFDAAKAEMEYKDLPRQLQDKHDNIRASIKQHLAGAANSAANTRLTNKKYQDLMKGGGGNFMLSGNQGSFSRKNAVSAQEKNNIIYRAYKLGIVDEDTYTKVHTKSSWISDAEFQTKQDDVISMILDHAGDEEQIRDIFTSNGFTYTEYAPKNNTKKARFK